MKTNDMPAMAGTANTRCGRLALISVLLALQCLPTLAFALDDAAKMNTISRPQAEVFWLSGGVGDEAMTEMFRLSAAYNVHLLMTGPKGNYLAGIPFTVSRRNGQVTLSGVTEGPLLYLKLPSGRYQIAADIDGAWQTRRVVVSNSTRVIQVRFVAKGE